LEKREINKHDACPPPQFERRDGCEIISADGLESSLGRAQARTLRFLQRGADSFGIITPVEQEFDESTAILSSYFGGDGAAGHWALEREKFRIRRKWTAAISPIIAVWIHWSYAANFCFWASAMAPRLGCKP